MKSLLTWTERRLPRLFRKLSNRQNFHLLKLKCSAFIRNTSFTENWKERLKNWVFVSSVPILVPSGYWATYRRHHLNFKTGLDFCENCYSLVSSEKIVFASVRICVLQLLCDGSEIATILNEFSQSLERKKNLSSLVYAINQNFPSFCPGYMQRMSKQ